LAILVNDRNIVGIGKLSTKKSIAQIEREEIKGEFEDLQTENVKKLGAKLVEIKELKPGESVKLRYIVKTQRTEDLSEKAKETLEKVKEKLVNKIKAEGTTTKPDPKDPSKMITTEIKGEGEKEVYITNKDLVIIKEAEEEYEIGDTVEYIIKVINNGEVEIKDIKIEESILGGKFIKEEGQKGIEIDLSGQKVKIDKIDSGETIILKYKYTITKDTKVIKENGKLFLENKISGTGKEEIEDPENEGNKITKEVEDEHTKRVEIVEQKEKAKGIIKKDIETGETLEGAIIGIYAGEDIKGKDGKIVIKKDTLIEKARTNVAGKAEYTADLPIGKYYIREIEAPEGYILAGHEGKYEKGKYKEEKKAGIKFSVTTDTIYYENEEKQEYIIDVIQYNDE